MTKRIFHSICLVALMIFIASLILIMGVLYGYFSGLQQEQLKMQTELAAQGVNNEGIAFLEDLNTDDYRITLIDADGRVLFDCKAATSQMENHLDREEVQEALRSGYGSSSRYSDTLAERSLYSAQRLDDGSILRLSIAQHSIFTLMLGMAQPICIVIAIALVLSLVLAYRLSKNIVRPLNTIDLDKPLSNDGYDELSPILMRIHSQQMQLKRQSNALQQKQDEFEAVTGSMSEGLILLNPKGTILSINHMAADLLDAEEYCTGKNILTVSRNLTLQEILSKALAGQRGEKIICLRDNSYQVDASPVISDGSVSGIALLIFDVTERENAEQMRREFTANVSHELRTPLHSISGYAELLKNGMVKSGDVKSVSGKIYAEAQRMVQLVEDIISLSHLDEGAEGSQKQAADLYAIACEAVENLIGEAENSGISLSVHGEKAVITGIPQLLSGIVFNLCDNAIKYNHPGGRVEVYIKKQKGETLLTVKDTGIGIPPEYQGRVFERFYRVDKSHSKEVGGTGLGLSIVKHAAKIHDAKIELESTVGQGTEITVRFPEQLPTA